MYTPEKAIKNDSFVIDPNTMFQRFERWSYTISDEDAFDKRILQIFFPAKYVVTCPDFHREERKIIIKIMNRFGYSKSKKIFRYKVKVLYDDQDLFKNAYGDDLKHTPEKKFNTYLVSKYELSY